MTDRSLNILIIAAWYPKHDRPTEGTFIEEQAYLLKRKGHNVTVLHPFLLGTFIESLGKKDKIQKASYHDLDVIRIGAKPALPGFRQLSYKKLCKTVEHTFLKLNIKLANFDLIHSHAMFMGGVVAKYLSEKHRIPFLHTEHTSGLIFRPNQYTSLDKQLIRSVFSRTQKTLFVSRFALDQTAKQLKIENTTNFEVLPNLVADEFFKSEPTELKNRDFSYIIICNLIPLKRVDLLLESWKILIEHFQKSKLTIAGEGPEKDRLIKMAEELGLMESVQFITRLDRTQVLEAIAQHHVLVSASQIETFGLTVAEAQAMGKPVVVTDSGGVRDIVTIETGIITENERNSLAIGLINIQKLYSSYNSELIREITSNKFSSGHIYTNLIKIYKELI